MGADDSGISTPDETLARHRTLAAVADGKRPMGWAEWGLPLYDIPSLTPTGIDTALWAVDALKRAFGNEFLQRAWARERVQRPAVPWEVAERHPVFSQSFWPAMNSAPWVIANLLQLASQLELFLRISRPVRRSMQQNLDPVNWIHGLFQLEVVGLALRAGWQPLFEPPLGTNRFADVRLTGPSTSVLVETTTLKMSDRERQELASAQALTWPLMMSLQDLQLRYAVQVSGTVERLTPEVDTAAWLSVVEAAASATARDGTARDIPADNDEAN